MVVKIPSDDSDTTTRLPTAKLFCNGYCKMLSSILQLIKYMLQNLSFVTSRADPGGGGGGGGALGAEAPPFIFRLYLINMLSIINEILS